MGVKSWREEFLPVEAEDATGSTGEAIAHSLQKWKGALPENLEKHEVKFENLEISGSEGNEFFGSSNCALCVAFFDYGTPEDTCKRCPLWYADGSRCEAGSRCFDPGRGYLKAKHNYGPQVMIAELQAAMDKWTAENT